MIDIVIPNWGLTMDDALLLDWLREVGDEVAEGDSLADLETDKANAEIVSPAAGVLREILVGPGTTVVPGQVIGRIEVL